MELTQSNLANAIGLAANLHEQQLDKAGLPYILHPIAVMLSMEKDDIEGRIVAILHDVVEDTCYEVDDIEDEFGSTIADAVDAISKREGETNMEYWKRLRQNALAKRVKLKDIAHNTSADRMIKLSVDERRYLLKKYEKALRVIQENDRN